MKGFRDGLIGPTVILFVICAAFTAAMAFVYDLTSPLILANELQKADEARRAVLETADGFTQIEAELPEGVSAAYRADNGAGYVFTSQAKGFGGAVVYVIGLDTNGEVTGITVFDHDETPGLGTKVANPDYLSRYYGGADPDSVDAVTGATRTSNSLKNSLKQAQEAYQQVKGAA